MAPPRHRGNWNTRGMEIGGAKVKFEGLAEDDAADPETGAIVAQKLVDAKVRQGSSASELQHHPRLEAVRRCRHPADFGLGDELKYTQQGFATASG